MPAFAAMSENTLPGLKAVSYENLAFFNYTGWEGFLQQWCVGARRHLYLKLFLLQNPSLHECLFFFFILILCKGLMS